MIKTNSELPITLLKSHNELLNDFDFVLFHLYISEPEYRKYFDEMRERKPERMMILDNSAYEFFVKGETLDLDQYEQAIIDLNPDYYILPDVLMDKEKTLMGVMQFEKDHVKSIENYFRNPFGVDAPQPLAVTQGKTIDEFNECLESLLNMGYTNIAIPFHNIFFKTEFESISEDIMKVFADAGYTELTDDVRYAMGRCMWMRRYGLDILAPDGKPRYTMIHFLGSHCPVEKRYLQSLFTKRSKVSMDTGYPVKLAIEGEVLGEEKSKPTTIIDDFMHNKFEVSQKSIISYNVNIFRDY